MIKRLTIDNYAIIDHVEIQFSDALSVITGETGAGKSILLGALGLVLGQRADSKFFQNPERKCTIEAEFDVSNYSLNAFFDDNELEFSAQECIIRRELHANGKSRSFINDSPASLSAIKELGSRLIDVHSQHQNLLLNNASFQLNVLDLLSPQKELLPQYREAYDTYRKKRDSIEALKKRSEEIKKEEEYIRFQYNQLAEATLKEGEDQELEAEQTELSHADEIKQAFYKVINLLEEDQYGVLARLKEIGNEYRSIAGVCSKADEYSKVLESNLIDIKELARENNIMYESVDCDPQRLQFVDERLNTIHTLKQKHKMASVEELLALQQQLSQKLERIDNIDEEIAQQKRDLSTLRATVETLGEGLTDERKKQASVLEGYIVDKMAQLAVPNIRFEVCFQKANEPTVSGFDSVSYLFTANKNAPLQPIIDSASGGEISRIMLCIKSLIASCTSLPTIIFDEIDTGVSGEIADKMGRIMREMSQFMQVIVITHLPQIASKGKSHFKVYKADTEEATNTEIAELSPSERIREIAGMLSASTLTDAALRQAEQLLNE